MKTRVLFVCVENSCRSQMAEGLARKLGHGVLEAWSAGSRASGMVNEMAVELLKERGIDISGHLSKGFDELPKVSWDYVVTMGCGDACPIVASKAKLDWGIPDPKALPREEFRRVRDEIEEKVRELIRLAGGA